jgi:hypothetical protein
LLHLARKIKATASSAVTGCPIQIAMCDSPWGIAHGKSAELA